MSNTSPGASWKGWRRRLRHSRAQRRLGRRITTFVASGVLLAFLHEAALRGACQRFPVFTDCFAPASVGLALFYESGLRSAREWLAVLTYGFDLAAFLRKRCLAGKHHYQRHAERDPKHLLLPFLLRRVLVSPISAIHSREAARS
jgi:hypothetical protein